MPTSAPAQLPPITGDYTVTPEQTQSYLRDGHITLRNVATTQEVSVWKPIFGQAVKDLSKEVLPLEKRSTYGKAFLQVGNLWKNVPSTQAFILARRFAKIAADLMGTDGVRMYHDQALYKEPHGGPTPWHQDQYYWPLATEKSITMWMPLVDIDSYMGSITFASGSQAEGYCSKLAISDESENFYQNLIKTKGYKVKNAGKMAAGDATFHAGWTVHGAPANRSDKPRDVMTIIYIDSAMRVGEVDNPGRVGDMKFFFPGLKAGDLADTEMTPVLYHKSQDAK